MIGRTREWFEVWLKANEFRPTTEFVRERLRSTGWADRAVILDLIRLEDYWRGGRQTATSAAHCSRLDAQFPSDSEIIRIEIQEGQRLTAEEALRARDAREQRIQAAGAERRQVNRDAELRREGAVHQKEYRRWLAAGGRP